MGLFSDSHMVYVFTRKQAIADGVLVDITPVGCERGVHIHSVMTANMLAELKRGEETLAETVTRMFDAFFDELHKQVKPDTPLDKYGSNFPFCVGEIECYANLGPDDDGKTPVLTYMLSWED